jgi:hypothetical protein
MEQNNTYWLLWQFDIGKFWLIDWQENEFGIEASKLFWPSLTSEQVQRTVLLECHEKQEPIERDITDKSGSNLPKLPFINTYIKAVPLQDDLFGDVVRCVYTVKEK